MKRASYREAIRWIARNDDCEWLRDPEGIFSVTTALVADLFDVHTDRVTADLRREHARARDNCKHKPV